MLVKSEGPWQMEVSVMAVVRAKWSCPALPELTRGQRRVLSGQQKTRGLPKRPPVLVDI